MVFKVDERIVSSSIFITDWPLSRIYLKDEVSFPWFILVPRVQDIEELYELDSINQQTLMKEIAQLSQVVKTYFNPDKLNLGALGNIVSQLHVHVVARFRSDPAWPQSIWQANLASSRYTKEVREQLVTALQRELESKKEF